MPIYRYHCVKCNYDFDEILTKTDEIKQHSDNHPCPKCYLVSDRIRVNSVSFAFKSKLPNGNSGSHAVDYPSLDVAVGRSAEKKWTKFYKDKEVRDKARKELGTNSITEKNGRITAVPEKMMDLREKGSKMFKKVNKKIK